VRGFRALHFAGPCVTIFGSARVPQEHRDYAMARHQRAEARLGASQALAGGALIREAYRRVSR